MGAISAKFANNSQSADGTPPAGSVTLAEMANLAAFSVIGNQTASAATPAAVPMDGIPGLASTPTAAGTTVLTNLSKKFQVFTGSTTQTVTLPVVSTLPVLGFGFWIVNESSGIVTVNSSGGNLVKSMAAGSRMRVVCNALTGTGAAVWTIIYTT
jgi:hypothetical protein